MRTYISPIPISKIKCKYCKQPLGYWIPGLDIKEHSHPECRAENAVKEIFSEIKRELNQK